MNPPQARAALPPQRKQAITLEMPAVAYGEGGLDDL
jgi:hypothetical protein